MHASSALIFEYNAAVSLNGRLIEVEGIRTFVHRAGSGDPVVLIHGLSASHFMWRAVAARLAQHREVIAFDLPGFGESDKPRPTDFDYSPANLAAFSAKLLAELGVTSATIAGHSFGGAVAINL